METNINYENIYMLWLQKIENDINSLKYITYI